MVRDISIDRRGLLLGAAAMGGAALLPMPALAQSLQKFNIVTTSGALAFGQLMKTKRYLQEFGIEPNVVPVSDGAKALAALVSGEMDIAVGTGFAQVLTAIEKGAKVKILAGGSMLSNATLVTNKSDIKSVKDLVGRTVGVGALGTQLHQLVTALLRKQGIDPAKVNFVNVGSIRDVFRAVAGGTVDAGPGSYDELGMLERYKLHELSDGRMWEKLPEYTNQATYVTDKTLAEKRDLVVRTLAAYAKLYRYIQDGDSLPDYTVARAQAEGKDEPEVARNDWKFYQDTKALAGNLVLSEEQFRFMQQLNVESGAQKAILPFAQIADMAPARDALKLL